MFSVLPICKSVDFESSSANLQAEFLRVLQEGEFERVGDETTRRVNVRNLAASGVKTFRYWQVSFFARLASDSTALCPIFLSMKWTSSLGTTGQAIFVNCNLW
jgi:hypothetical protein